MIPSKPILAFALAFALVLPGVALSAAEAHQKHDHADDDKSSRQKNGCANDKFNDQTLVIQCLHTVFKVLLCQISFAYRYHALIHAVPLHMQPAHHFRTAKLT